MCFQARCSFVLSTAALCFLLVACAGGPNSGGTSGGASGGASGSSSSGVTKTAKEEPPECNVELYLPAHMPEHCKPDEKLAASKSTPAQKAPDPIVGTYHVYSIDEPRESVLRLYPNGRAVLGYRNYRWRYENGEYLISWGKDYRFSMKYQRKSSFGNVRVEPELVTLNDAPIYGKFEALKVSDGPDFKFNLYKLAIVRKEPSSLACFNLGQKKYRYTEIPKELGYPSFESSSLTECEASCQPFRDGRKELNGKRCPGEVVAKSPENDPIIGTYRMFTTESDGFWNSKHSQYVMRIFPNNRASKNGRNDFYRWEREGELYKFYVRRGGPGSPTAYDRFSGTMKYQSIVGKPHLITMDHVGHPGWPSESLKISTDPSHQFDLYKVACSYTSKNKCFKTQRDAEGKPFYKSGKVEGNNKHVWIQDALPGWSCMNIGRYRGSYSTNYPIYGDAPDWGDTLAQCESRCEQALLNQFETVGEGNCANFGK